MGVTGTVGKTGTSSGSGGGATALPFHFALVPDVSGNVWWAPDVIDTGASIVPTAQVLSFLGTASGFAYAVGVIVPSNYVTTGTPKFRVRYKTTASGTTTFVVGYRSVSPTASGAPTTFQETLSGASVAGAGQTVIDKTLVLATPANLIPGDTLFLEVGISGSSVAGNVNVIGVTLEWS